MATATAIATPPVSPNLKRLDSIESLVRSISGETNRLIKEVKVREQASPASAKPSSKPADVPWIDFQKRATEALGFDTMGWKGEVERQLNLREGTLKACNLRQKVPHGYMHLCDEIKASTPEKAERLGWGEDEKAALHEFSAAGQSVAQIRRSMFDRFGDRRDYLADGPVLGALKREGLKANK